MGTLIHTYSLTQWAHKQWTQTTHTDTDTDKESGPSSNHKLKIATTLSTFLFPPLSTFLLCLPLLPLCFPSFTVSSTIIITITVIITSSIPPSYSLRPPLPFSVVVPLFDHIHMHTHKRKGHTETNTQAQAQAQAHTSSLVSNWSRKTHREGEKAEKRASMQRRRIRRKNGKKVEHKVKTITHDQLHPHRCNPFYAAIFFIFLFGPLKKKNSPFAQTEFPCSCSCSHHHHPTLVLIAHIAIFLFCLFALTLPPCKQTPYHVNPIQLLTLLLLFN